MNRHEGHRFLGTTSRRAARMLVIAVALLSSCETPGAQESVQAHAREHPEFRRMRAELAPMTWDLPSDTPFIRAYYADVSRGIPGVRHDTGLVAAAGVKAAVHVWRPVEGTDLRGTVFVVHGYLAHPLQHAALIRSLLQERFVVVAPELPGHALSGGARGAIRDFSQYGAFLRDVVRSASSHVPRPWHAVGHSTGATTIYEYVRRFDDPFDAVVFVAPLVRSRFYGLSRVGRFLLRPFLDTVATGYSDPLGVERMPLSWFDEQVEWNRRKSDYERVNRAVLVLQGTDDDVVAWRYNRRFLQDAFAEVDYRLFDGAGHVLFRAEPDIRRAAVDLTTRYILERTTVEPDATHGEDDAVDNPR